MTINQWGPEPLQARTLEKFGSDRGFEASPQTPGGERIPQGLGPRTGGPANARPWLRAAAAVTPVDPAGPDRYRGRAKPWESNAPPLRGVADG